MKIKRVTWEYRFDFHAIMECEHCGDTRENKVGYNDTNYHLRVIPAMICGACGKNRAGQTRADVERFGLITEESR